MMERPEMESRVQQCQKILGYEFNDQHLCWEALQMAGNGVLKAGKRPVPNGNKRLAVLGQFALPLVLSEEWYATRDDEGSWNTVRSTVIANVNLGKLGSDQQLGACVQLGNGQSAITPKMMSITVEALIGAVYLDSRTNGLDDVKGVVRKLGIQYEALSAAS